MYPYKRSWSCKLHQKCVWYNWKHIFWFFALLIQCNAMYNSIKSSIFDANGGGYGRCGISRTKLLKQLFQSAVPHNFSASKCRKAHVSFTKFWYWKNACDFVLECFQKDFSASCAWYLILDRFLNINISNVSVSDRENIDGI